MKLVFMDYMDPWNPYELDYIWTHEISMKLTWRLTPWRLTHALQLACSHTLYSTLIRFFLEVFLLAQSVLVVHTEQIVLAVPRLCFETWWKTSESLLATWNGRLQPLETFCSRMDQRSQYGSFSMGSAGSSSDSSTDSYVQNRLRLCFYRTGWWHINIYTHAAWQLSS